MASKDEDPIDKNIAEEVALLEKRSGDMYCKNKALREQIVKEQRRQETYENMKIDKAVWLEDIAEQEQEHAYLLAIQAELSRQSALMEAEVLEAQKAADAKHENEDDTAKE
jgi:hypothetical protein